MSKFAVTIETVSEVIDHPNADRLDIIKIENNSYQFIAPRDSLLPNDLVVYFPLDSLIPNDVLSKIGLKEKLSGKLKNRVKTVKLRGVPSQGLVVPVQQLFHVVPDPLYGQTFFPDIHYAVNVSQTKKFLPLYSGVDVTEYLRVEKYEPEEVLTQKGEHLVALPYFIQKYDIENAERYPTVVETLLDQKVYISEKLEGSNFAVGLDEDNIFYVCQRNYAIKTDSDHTWVSVARKLELEDTLKKIKSMYGCKTVVLRGELVGPKIQGNIYDFKNWDVRFFDAELDGKFLNPDDFISLMFSFKHNIQYVPTLANGYTLRELLEGSTLQGLATDKSHFGDTLREGIVIKPVVEQYHPEIGRLILKVRSIDYLEQQS